MKKIYVSHPYGGLKENKESVDELLKSLVNAEATLSGDAQVRVDNDVKFISPIHQLGEWYGVLPYVAGIDMCLLLLSHCDYILLCGFWPKSRGCMAEYAFAKAMGIPILSIEGAVI